MACFASISGQPPITTNPIGAFFAFHLFDTKRDFEDAFQLFYKLKTDPTLVIGLCPGLLGEEDSAKLQYPASPMVCFCLTTLECLLIFNEQHFVASCRF